MILLWGISTIASFNCFTRANVSFCYFLVKKLHHMVHSIILYYRYFLWVVGCYPHYPTVHLRRTSCVLVIQYHIMGFQREDTDMMF